MVHKHTHICIPLFHSLKLLSFPHDCSFELAPSAVSSLHSLHFLLRLIRIKVLNRCIATQIHQLTHKHSFLSRWWLSIDVCCFVFIVFPLPPNLTWKQSFLDLKIFFKTSLSVFCYLNTCTHTHTHTHTHTVLDRSFLQQRHLSVWCLCMCVPVAQWYCIALATQKVVGSIPREHTYWQKLYSLNAL